MQVESSPVSEAIELKAASFLNNIKQSTADLHLRLESQALLSAIMMPSVTKLQYYYYLSLMLKIEEVYERIVVKQLVGTFPGFEQRKASLLLLEDLKNIGDIAPETFMVKDYNIAFEKISIPFALGFMYVMEGSKLGGKVIYKHIHRTLGYSANDGAKFIADTGNNTFVLWKEFLSTFSIFVAENECEEEAIQGAEYAFRSIHDFFESNRLIYEN
jgi:heme oxygenase